MNEGLFQFFNRHAGCAAKMNWSDMETVLSKLPSPFGRQVSTDFRNWEDVGVFDVNPTQSLVITIDMITPIVDDPYIFGQIAASHALSDIYAKGISPAVAMNILAFPTHLASPKIARSILEGVMSKLNEANTVMLGGHCIKDDTPKVGLATVAFCRPNELIKNAGSQPGDTLILTKALGTGIISTAIRYRPDDISAKAFSEAVASMQELNSLPQKVMAEVGGVNACTDVTGFGFLGHLYLMVKASGVSANVEVEAVKMFSEVIDLAMDGVRPQLLDHNMDYLTLSQNALRFSRKSMQESPKYSVLFDPQTSGGLLISVGSETVDALLEGLRRHGVTFSLIGEVIKSEEKDLIFLE